ncbi:MAG: GGDEF domain-containing phosphodiesterase, partial [Pseudomonadota bacterium]
LEESGVDDACKAAERITSMFESPIHFDNMQVRVDISAGIVAFPEHGDTAETLMRRADIAMYAAKDLEKMSYSVYEPGRDEEHLRRLRLSNDLRTALRTNALTMHYQPKVDLRTNEVCSVEALVRWIHPEFGFLPPDEFIPLAEKSGHIKELTAYVLRTVMRQMRVWKEKGLDLTVAVNLSAHDLLDDTLPSTIAALLRDHGLSAKALILEVTESAVMKDAAYARGVMARLREQGIRLSIDDFGTGQASLSQLKSLPVDELKIDKSFVRDLTDNEDDKVIVLSIINLAHNMGLEVTAEGVETEDSRRLLESFECDVIQGYLISKPLADSDLTAWLTAQTGQRDTSNEDTAGIDALNDGETSALALG